MFRSVPFSAPLALLFAASAAATVCVVRVDVGDGRDADARRLDDVDGVDADVRTDMARRRDVVPRHVGRDDGRDDAAILRPCVVALSRGARQDRPRRGLRPLTVLVGAGYFCVWTVFGMAAFAVGVALAALEMQMAGAGACRSGRGCAGRARRRRASVHCVEGASPCLLPGGAGAPRLRIAGGAGTAWRYGLRLGLHCRYCCAGLTAILLVIGIMDLRAMALVTAAITAERLVPAGERVARGVGIAAVGAGVWLIMRAVVLV